MGISRVEILSRLNQIFQEVFDNDSLEIDETITADEIEEWDSIEHISLVIACEREFDIRLKAVEVGRLKNVGSLVDLVEARTSSS